MTQIMSYPGIRLVNNFPPFPDNPFGLQRGSFVFTEEPKLAAKFGFPVGHPIPLCFDGKIVRCNTIGWNIDGLVQGINEGIWKIGEGRVADELIATIEYQMGGQVTVEEFWTKLWETQTNFPERFKLQTSPDVSADDLKQAAAKAGKRLFIHMEMEPSKLETTADGTSSLVMMIGNSDKGYLEGSLQLTLNEMASGDRFFICQITS
jgi:hypothetical protein